MITGVLGPDQSRVALHVGPQRGVEELAPTGQVFLKANVAALRQQFHYAAPLATAAANHWVVLKPGTPHYRATAQGTTTAEVVHQLRLPGPLQVGRRRTVAGRSVVALINRRLPRADGGGRGTMYVTTGRTPLPLRIVMRPRQVHAVTVVTFSHIGTPAAIHFPVHAAPLP